MTRYLLFALVSGCVAPLTPDAYVMLDEDARAAGVTIEGVEVVGLPMAVPGGELLALLTPDGPLTLDPYAGEVLHVRGADAEVTWHLLGDDIDPDALAIGAEGDAISQVLDALEGELELDGDYAIVRAPGAFIRASDLDPIDGLHWTEAVAFPGSEAVWHPEAEEAQIAERPGDEETTVTGQVAKMAQRLVGQEKQQTHRRASVSDPKPWVDTDRLVRVESGAQYVDGVIGAGAMLDGRAQIVVDYQMWVDDGPVVDSSLKRGNPSRFPFLRGALIRGWEEGLLGMREGGTRVLVVPPEAAYGERGRPGLIGPESILTFEVTLIEILPPKTP